MTITEYQLETIAAACAVTTELVKLVVTGGDYRAFSDSASRRVRAALKLIGFIAPIPRVAAPVVFDPRNIDGMNGVDDRMMDR